MAVQELPLLQTIADGLLFTESPRWRDGRVWFSNGPHVCFLRPGGSVTTYATLPTRLVLGVGFLADGRVAAVAAMERTIFAINGDGTLDVFADLSDRLTGPVNEIIAGPMGGLYVGPMGFDMLRGEKPAATRLLYVGPAGKVKEVGSELLFPNGMALSRDGSVLFVAETFANRVVAFDVAKDGSLENGRTCVDSTHPDGICLDESGAVWCASPLTGEVLLLAEGNQVQQRLRLDHGHPTSCVLGDEDRRTLFVTATDEMPPQDLNFTGKAFLLSARVSTPGIG